MKALFDTNVWIAAAQSKRGFCRQLLRFSWRRCELVVSQPLLDEVEEKLRLKLKWSDSQARQGKRIVRRFCTEYFFRPLTERVCRDPDDDMILATASISRCEYLITGDDDLLSLGTFRTTTIVNPRAFSSIIGMPQT